MSEDIKKILHKHEQHFTEIANWFYREKHSCEKLTPKITRLEDRLTKLEFKIDTLLVTLRGKEN